MDPLQILVGIASLFALSRAYLRYRDGKLSGKELLFWTGIWVAVLVVAFHPEITTKLSRYFGIGRGIDLVIYSSIILIFYLLFRIYVKLETLEQDFTKTVRELAFINAEKEHEKEKKSHKKK